MIIMTTENTTTFVPQMQIPRFQLDRRPGRSRLKTKCPKCGRDRCFTLYIDVKTGQPVGQEFGRCDHERKCGYDNRPTGKDIGDRELFISNNEARKGFQYPVSPEIANCIPYPEWAKFVNPGESNTLFKFLSMLWPEYLVKEVFRRFNIGTMDVYGWKGCSVFWQVDKNFVCRSAKVMEYEIKEEDGKPVDVKRVKGEDFAHVTYYHALKGADYVFKQCLFGEHLLNFYPDNTTVNLVEAEKTAVIATLNKPGMLFVATGGLKNFRPEVMGVLRGRKVVAYPDKGGAFDTWVNTINQKLPGYKITVSNILQDMDELNDGDDFADLIIKRKIKEL